MYGRLLKVVGIGYPVFLHFQLKEMPGQVYAETFVLPLIIIAIFVRAVISGMNGDNFRRAAMTLFMFIYVVYLISYSIQLRFLPDGSLYVFYLFLITWTV